MKKLLSLSLALLMSLTALTAVPFASSAEAKHLETVEVLLTGDSVAFGGPELSAFLVCLNYMSEEGLIIRGESYQSFDLDKDGSIDFTYDAFTGTEEGDGFAEFYKKEGYSIVGTWETEVPQTVKDRAIAGGYAYCDKIVIMFDDICSDGGEHDWQNVTVKATFETDGGMYTRCSKCGKDECVVPLAKANSVRLSSTSYTYNGKAKKPSVKVKNAFGDRLEASQYQVTYSDNVNAGTATVRITLTGDYYEGTKTLTFKIKKAPNALKLKAKTATVRYEKLKKAKQSVARKKVLAVRKAKGTVTYKKVKGNKRITVSKKTGKLTLKKGLKKGAYKIRIRVTAGDKNHVKISKTATVTVKVG